ncbi:HNH endonuclease signature motif containing protein, partial [Zhihengliuella salsuginis]|uniref:HNH endonuclease signature motif containing protein n=1 Tax=Zhihengliuella salsuginis TaxID=578222 RepID=UPI00167374B3
RVGAAHARTLIDLARKIEPDRPDTPRTGDLEDIETYDQQVIDAELDCRQHRQDLCASLLEKTPGRTPSAVKRTGTRLLNRLLDTSATDRHTIEHAKRTVRITAGENGMCNLHAYLPVLAGEAIGNRLSELATLHTDPAVDQAVNTLHPEDQPGPATERDHASSTRTRAQARADALVELLLAGPDGSGLENVAPAVTISIPATVFPGLTGLNPAPGHPTGPEHDADAGTGPARTPGPRAGGMTEEPGTASTDRLDGLRLPAGAVAPETETLGAFDPADLAALLPNATTWTRIITDPWTGAMTAYDTRQYRPTAAMRRALGLRDRTCRVPGCGRRASACEPDHVIEWQDGGATSLDNLVSLCKRCHRLKSWGLLHLKLSPGGTLHATTWWDRQRAGTADAPWDTPAEPVGDTSPWTSRHRLSPAETELLRGLARHLEWVNRRATGHSITSLSPTKKARHK